jgi:hypothetical protein
MSIYLAALYNLNKLSIGTDTIQNKLPMYFLNIFLKLLSCNYVNTQLNGYKMFI